MNHEPFSIPKKVVCVHLVEVIPVSIEMISSILNRFLRVRGALGHLTSVSQVCHYIWASRLLGQVSHAVERGRRISAHFDRLAVGRDPMHSYSTHRRRE